MAVRLLEEPSLDRSRGLLVDWRRGQRLQTPVGPCRDQLLLQSPDCFRGQLLYLPMLTALLLLLLMMLMMLLLLPEVSLALLLPVLGLFLSLPRPRTRAHPALDLFQHLVLLQLPWPQKLRLSAAREHCQDSLLLLLLLLLVCL